MSLPGRVGNKGGGGGREGNVGGDVVEQDALIE